MRFGQNVFLGLVCCLFAAHLAAGTAVAADKSALPEYSLAEIIEMTGAASEALKDNQLQLQITEAEVDNHLLSHMPKIKLDFGYQIEQSANKEDDFPIGKVSLQYDLINLEQFFHHKKERMHLSLGQTTRSVADKAVIKAVTLNYYRLVNAIERKQVTKEFLQRMQSQVATVKRRQRAGKATGSDLFMFQLDATELRSTLVELDAEIARLQRKIARHLPESVSSFKPKDKLPHFHLEASEADLMQSLAEAPALKIARDSERHAYYRARARSLARLPRLGVQVAAGYFEPDFSLEREKPQVEGKLMLSWDLFPGLFSRADRRLENKKHESEQIRLAIENRATRDAVRDSIDRLKILQDRVDLERSRLGLARKLYTAVTAEYRRGVKSSEAVESASKAIYEAQLADLNYRFEFIEVVKQLEAALGRTVAVSQH